MITRQQVIDKAREIVARNPGQVNPSNSSALGCVYSTKQKEHCIAGQIIVEFGGKVPGPYSRSNGSDIESLINSNYRKFIGIEFDDDAINILQNMQMHADGGNTWKSAIQYALR